MLIQRVSFDEQANVLHENPWKHLRLDLSKLWYTAEELQRLKRLARDAILAELNLAKQQQQQKQQQQKAMTTASDVQQPQQEPSRMLPLMGHLHHIHTALSEMEYEVHDAEILFSNEFQWDSDWVNALYSTPRASLLIGLETHLVPSLRKAILTRRQDLCDCLMDIQDEWEQGLITSGEQVEDEISESCRAISQASVLLAQILARARAQAVFHEEEEASA